MSKNYEKISILNIVAKVYQDFGINEDEDVGKFIEWISEVIGLLNIPTYYDTVHECIHIKNYKAEIPLNLVHLQEVEYKGVQLDKGSTGSIHSNIFNSDRFYYTPKSHNQDKITNVPFIAAQCYKFNNNDTFIMENGWFKTSFKEGTINIKYTRLPLDEDGFILIPYEESLRNAIVWYCGSKWFYIKAINEDRFRWFYQDAFRKYQYYAGQAGAKAIMPDVFTMENIKRNFIRLVPKLNEYKSLFSNLNSTSNG